ncbi:low choriolytic enzyme-like [Corythoichthys intestinalis]|uniref:low choriolytic enzyme-like n=1 Tax=Corythoichthys intestinalis TaxID=161448 RepID=UPI0025A5BB24|nr:low choriolytic enzyme-like [Corythoichthys intestinalis]XP_057692163.1 low choriolytic enzyme-like [Corythoichthys intestinalis]XP_057692174.1 low choriolytic enzyme-like [Corythoichthys intestinalis]XP_057692184.1 low choriolytic enzyme-like [Corythoichthys intestinalis]XP_057692196.1 low choriolytic enzyme-like [Corythoichthys intestinalis]XP_061811179.1 low choriolytic enzyme-like [Nerophis lumbriciformis]
MTAITTAITTAISAIIILLLLIGVCPTASQDEIGLDNLGVSDSIAGANVNTTTFLTHGDIAPNLQRNAVPCTRRGCKWPKWGRRVYVPVTISSRFTSQERRTIIRALVSFHRSTCIRFMWKRSWQKTYLHFFSGSGCWSYLGRQRGRQLVSLRKNGCVRHGIVQHEVLHALGFHHEQVRSDRDAHVRILFQNIISGFERNFQKVNTNNLGTPYDFDSIMHYSKFAFSKNRQPTIVAKRDPGRMFGLSSSMTRNDIARVNALYRCRRY